MLKSKLSELTKEMKTQDTYQKKISPMHTPKKGHIQNSQRAEELSKLKNKTNGNKKWARFEYTLHTHTHCVVIQSLSCVQLFDLMDGTMPDLPVLHYLLEFAQTHVH